MRSWQSGVTRLRATSPGLKDAVAEGTNARRARNSSHGKTPLAQNRPYVPFGSGMREQTGDSVFGLEQPDHASSNAPDHSSRLVNDGNAATYWAPAAGDTAMSVTLDIERVLEIHRLDADFPAGSALWICH